MQSTTEDQFRSIIESHFDVLSSFLVKQSDKVDIVQALALHDILRSKGELDQFCEGFESCGVLKAIRQNPDLARNYFCIDGHEKLTSGTLRLS